MKSLHWNIEWFPFDHINYVGFRIVNNEDKVSIVLNEWNTTIDRYTYKKNRECELVIFFFDRGIWSTDIPQRILEIHKWMVRFFLTNPHFCRLVNVLNLDYEVTIVSLYARPTVRKFDFSLWYVLFLWVRTIQRKCSMLIFKASLKRSIVFELWIELNQASIQGVPLTATLKKFVFSK